jgi:pSer/pThr/pTyr-binding forkhead associated (FHA) protein
VPYVKLLVGDRAHEVREASALLGRDPSAAIVFGPEAAVVSGRHAELRYAGDGWRIHDLQSRNGVFLNGRRVQGDEPVSVGDEIRLGETGPRIRVAAVTEEPAAPPTQVELPALVSSSAAPAAEAGAAAAPPLPEIRPYAITLLAADTGRRFEARGTRIRIGRGKECEVRPVDTADAAVSRVHAELLVGPTGALTLKDAGSTNGTLLNGEPLAEPTPVRLGDRIQLGRAGPVLIVEGLGTSPGIPVMRRDGLGHHTVMGRPCS